MFLSFLDHTPITLDATAPRRPQRQPRRSPRRTRARHGRQDARRAAQVCDGARGHAERAAQHAVALSALDKQRFALVKAANEAEMHLVAAEDDYVRLREEVLALDARNKALSMRSTGRRELGGTSGPSGFEPILDKVCKVTKLSVRASLASPHGEEMEMCAYSKGFLPQPNATALQPPLCALLLMAADRQSATVCSLQLQDPAGINGLNIPRPDMLQTASPCESY